MPMRAHLVATVLVLTAGMGLAQGRPGPFAQAARDPAPAPSLTGSGSEWPPPSAVTVAPPPVGSSEQVFSPDDRTVGPDMGRGRGGRFWARGEYLLWWTEGSRLPPLVTTGVPGATPFQGAIGQPGTQVLYGDSHPDGRPRSGGRFTAGLWCDPCQPFGVEGSYFFLANRTTNFSAASDSTVNSTLIARPFFDVLTGNQNAQLVAFPALAGGTNLLTPTGLGLASGDIRASTYSRIHGGDVNAICGLCAGCDYWVHALAGFRYLHLGEGIAIHEHSRVNPVLPAGSPFFGGSSISVADQFDTRNNFYGGQVGLRGEVRRGRVFVEAQGKVALGVTNQVVEVQGATAITSPDGVTTVTPAGFLASGTNSGRFERNRFSVVTEVGVNGGYQVTDSFRVFVGYNFLHWSSVVRPADQIDLGLSGTNIPTDNRYNPGTGPARPGVPFRDTGMWIQGVSFGAEVRF
jgi:hypothetical protein